MACNEEITTHVDGHQHAFLKSGIVVDIHVFDETSHTGTIVDDVIKTFEHENVICLCGHGLIPKLYSTWDGTAFADPTPQWLYKNGYMNADPDAPKPTVEETPAATAESTAPTA